MPKSTEKSAVVLEPGGSGRWVRHGPLVISVLVHLGILAVVGSWVLLGDSPGTLNRFELREPFAEEETTQPPEEKSWEEPQEITDALEEPGKSSADEGGGGGMAGGGAMLDGILAVSGFQSLSAPAFLVDPAATRNSQQDLRSASALGSGGGSGVGSGGGRGGRKKSLFGLEVQTTNQGMVVFLDNSGSMQEISGKVRAMVGESLPDAKVIDIKGGLFANQRTLNRMKRERGEQDYYYQYYASMMEKSILVQAERYLAGRAVMPESIYMLSDFADYVDKSALDDFQELLQKNRIKFFAHSVIKEPHEAVVRLCKRTGGQVLVQPVVGDMEVEPGMKKDKK